MKIKATLILLTLFTLTANAQNITMAKAFFKKAQKEFEAKKYKETLNLIKKTKENLNGETNPDIIYLEAKTRFESQANINTAKELFKEFLAQASEDDSRINEVSTILVDIETSGDFCENGNKKSYKYLSETGELKLITFSDCNLQIQNTIVFRTDKEIDPYKIIFREKDLVKQVWLINKDGSEFHRKYFYSNGNEMKIIFHSTDEKNKIFSNLLLTKQKELKYNSQWKSSFFYQIPNKLEIKYASGVTHFFDLYPKYAFSLDNFYYENKDSSNNYSNIYFWVIKKWAIGREDNIWAETNFPDITKKSAKYHPTMSLSDINLDLEKGKLLFIRKQVWDKHDKEYIISDSGKVIRKDLYKVKYETNKSKYLNSENLQN